jgi:hypothetical protein
MPAVNWGQKYSCFLKLKINYFGLILAVQIKIYGKYGLCRICEIG